MSYWDATRIRALKTCRRMFQLQHEQGIVGKETSVHLVFGAAVAQAQEIYFGTPGDHAERLRAVVRFALGVELPEHRTKTPYTLVRTLVWYFDEYKGDKVHVLQDGTPAVELSFDVDVAPGIAFCGHLDRVVERDGQLYILDQKTTGYSLDHTYFAKAKTEDQFFMYSFVAKHLLGSPIRGIIVDAMQIAVGFSRFSRQLEIKKADQLAEWFNDTIYLIRQHEADEHRPMNLASCQNYGGCDYLGICTASPRMRERVIEHEYRVAKVWNPMEKR